MSLFTDKGSMADPLHPAKPSGSSGTVDPPEARRAPLPERDPFGVRGEVPWPPHGEPTGTELADDQVDAYVFLPPGGGVGPHKERPISETAAARLNPPPDKTDVDEESPPSGLFPERLAKGRGHPVLEIISDLGGKVLTGDLEAFEALKGETKEAPVGWLVLAIEEAIFRKVWGEAYQRVRSTRALERLHLLEREWRICLERNGKADEKVKRARVEEYVARAKKEGLNLDLDKGEVLDAVYKIVLLHEFIYNEAKLLEPYHHGNFPATVTDFLNGDVGRTPMWGACKSVTTLAVHLARRAGIPIRFYQTTQHVNTIVEVGDGFIYDPTAVFQILHTGRVVVAAAKDAPLLLPRGIFIRDFKAADAIPTADIEVLVGQALMVPSLLFEQGILKASDLTFYHQLAVDLFPDNFVAHWALAAHEMHPEIRDLADAGKHLDLALALHPNSFEALLHKGIILFEEKKYSDSLACFEKCRALLKVLDERIRDDTDVMVMTPLPMMIILYNLSFGRLCHEGLGRPDLAREQFSFILQRIDLAADDPRLKEAKRLFVVASDDVASVLAQRGDFVGAGQILEDAARVIPNHTSLWNAASYYLSGEAVADALRLFEADRGLFPAEFSDGMRGLSAHLRRQGKERLASILEAAFMSDKGGSEPSSGGTITGGGSAEGMGGSGVVLPLSTGESRKDSGDGSGEPSAHSRFVVGDLALAIPSPSPQPWFDGFTTASSARGEGVRTTLFPREREDIGVRIALHLLSKGFPESARFVGRLSEDQLRQIVRQSRPLTLRLLESSGRIDVADAIRSGRVKLSNLQTVRLALSFAAKSEGEISRVMGEIRGIAMTTASRGVGSIPVVPPIALTGGGPGAFMRLVR